MSLSNADRLGACADRMRWFEENERDIRKETFQPYLNIIDSLIRQMEEEKTIPIDLLELLEDTIHEAETECQPEDAHAFVYVKDFKF